jgi:2-polyprenyl-6-methoxyphenol hydroxylase-like FAD-dependent oxidoreductase
VPELLHNPGMSAAIVGAGAAGFLHALSFRAHGVPVSFVFDPDAARAKNLAELCGARVVAGVDALARTDVDCISICSPPRWHVEQAERCAGKGRTVFVEKPVAVSAEELARLALLPGCVPILQWRVGRAIRAIPGGLRRAPRACAHRMRRPGVSP